MSEKNKNKIISEFVAPVHHLLLLFADFFFVGPPRPIHILRTWYSSVYVKWIQCQMAVYP